MNCQEFWDAMPELEGGPDREAPPHVRECHACAALLDNQRALAAEIGRASCRERVYDDV